MNSSEAKNLGYLGEDFQIRLIHAFIEDGDFFRDLSTILDQNMFTDVNMRIYVGMMLDYYNKYQTSPSYTSMEHTIRDKIHNDIDCQCLLTFNDDLKKVDTESIDQIRDIASRFFKQQNIVRVANEILKVVASNNADEDKYDKCVSLLNNAINVGSKEDMGHDVFEGIEETLSEDYRYTIPTGIAALDVTLEGGLAKGELGMIICPSGYGKTSLTTGMAFHAATYDCKNNNYQGFKVLQIVFEDRIKQIQRKHIGRITNIEARNLSKPDLVESVKSTLSVFPKRDMLGRNLKIVRFPSGEITADYIKHYILKQINAGFKPDLVVIDYFECLKHLGGKNDSEYDKEGQTMRKFEAMAGDLNIAIWIPSQGSRESINAELVTMDKVSGSIKKAQIVHVILSIARSTEDIANNKATLALLKNRAGCSGKIWEGVYFNNGTCVVDTTDVVENGTVYDFKLKKVDDINKMQKTLAEKVFAAKAAKT